MKYSEAKPGRIFIVKLEDGDIIHECLEQFAAENNIKAATLTALGGVDKGSVLIVGPEESRSETIKPMETVLEDAHECTGTGTIFLDSNNSPMLHMHIACGRKNKVVTGCVRRGVKVWLVLEVIVNELVGTDTKRVRDGSSGFELLQP